MRLIDGDELLKKQHDVVLKNGAKHRCICREDIDEAPTIEPNLVINPDEVKRGDVTMIGAEIVVMHYDDYMEMMLKSAAVDDGSWERFAAEPCEDAISREWLLKFFEEDEGKDRHTPIDSLIALIKDAPSVAPSRPSGEWILKEQRILDFRFRADIIKCSKCDNEEYRTSWRIMNFCPACGAKMGKEGE